MATVTNTETDVARTIETNNDGRLGRALAIPPGTYRISIDRPGFAPLSRDGVVLQLGRVRIARFHDGAGDTRGRRHGRCRIAVVETGHTSVSTVVGQEQVQNLPTNGRNFLSFTVMTPGVTTDRTPQQGATATSGLSFTGQRGRSNNLMVDGFDNNDPTLGAVRATFSQEAVREFQVLTSSYSAERRW